MIDMRSRKTGRFLPRRQEYRPMLRADSRSKNPESTGNQNGSPTHAASLQIFLPSSQIG
jgi:hypothetical protein